MSSSSFLSQRPNANIYVPKVPLSVSSWLIGIYTEFNPLVAPAENNISVDQNVTILHVGPLALDTKDSESILWVVTREKFPT